MSLTILNTTNIFQKDVIGNVRTAQEDSHDIAALTPNGDIFVVCDGMGGHIGGKQASTIAVKSIIDYLKREKYSQPQAALNEALQYANMQILGYANEHPELRGMGTTACIVMLQESEAFIAHVGDSRIYLYLGKEKQLHRITKDHSFVQTLVDAGQISDEEAEHHPNKNRILKALGIKPELSPSFGNVIPKNGDIFLICSDGLCGMITDLTITDVLAQDSSISEKGETLIDLALKAGGHDNITIELIQITTSPSSKSVFNSYNPSSRSNDSRDKTSITETANNKTGQTSFSLKRISIIISIAIFTIATILGTFFIYHKWSNAKKEQKIELEISNIENEQLPILNKKISEDSIKCKKQEETINNRENSLLNDPQNKDLRLSIEISQKALDIMSTELETKKQERAKLIQTLKQLNDSLTKLQQ